MKKNPSSFFSRFFLRSSATNLVECESRKQIYRLEVRRRNALFFLLKRQSGVSHVNLDGKEKEEEEETEQLCLLFGGGNGYSWSFILLLKAGSCNRVFKAGSLGNMGFVKSIHFPIFLHLFFKMSLLLDGKGFLPLILGGKQKMDLDRTSLYVAQHRR